MGRLSFCKVPSTGQLYGVKQLLHCPAKAECCGQLGFFKEGQES